LTIYVASRHEGAKEWLENHGYSGIVQTFWNKHLTKKIGPGDIIVGNLPIYVINAILAQGARVYLIGIPGWPGNKRHETLRDLSAEEMDKKKAYLTEVVALKMVKVDL
jgi:putative CRISPR-associated protein (TIGR02620 family)